MKKVLITGANGILGQILSEGLKNKYEVIGLDKIEADISDIVGLREFFNKLPQIDSIIHFAADPYPFASWENVSKNNIEGTRNIYEMAKEFSIPKVVFASSTHTIGKYPNYPKTIEGQDFLTTLDPVRPDEFYGASKVVGEIIGRTYSDLFNISSINLRIGHTTAHTKHDPELDKVELFEDDLIDIVQKSIEANVKFGVYFAVSDNPGRFLDIENARIDLGYNPKKR